MSAGLIFMALCFLIGTGAALTELWLARRRGRTVLSNRIGQNFRLEDHEHILDPERSEITVRPNGTIIARCAVYGCQHVRPVDWPHARARMGETQWIGRQR